MQYETIKIWIDLTQWLTTAAVGLYVYAVNRHRVTNARISALEEHVDKRMDDHSDRLARLEQDARHAPSHEDLKRIHHRLDSVNGELREMRGEFHAANRTLELIHQHLLDGK